MTVRVSARYGMGRLSQLVGKIIRVEFLRQQPVGAEAVSPKLVTPYGRQRWREDGRNQTIRLMDTNRLLRRSSAIIEGITLTQTYTAQAGVDPDTRPFSVM